MIKIRSFKGQMSLFENNNENNDETFVGIASTNLYDTGLYSTPKNSLLGLKLPRSYKKELQMARDYVWNTAILFRIIKTKIDFISAGFDIVHSDEKHEKVFKDLYKRSDINRFVRNSAFELEVIGDVYPYFNWHNNDLTNISTLNPELVNPMNIFGEDLIFLKPDSEVLRVFNTAKKNPQVMARLAEIIPEAIFESWKQGKEALLPKDVSFRKSIMRAYHENKPHTPIYPIMPDLELMQTLIAGDYAVADKIRNAIFHVQIGDKDFNEGKVHKKIIQNTEKLFANPGKNLDLYTAWWIKADWIIPDAAVFQSDKYKAVNQRILTWSGLEAFIYDGGTYASGSIRLTPFKQSVRNTRRLIAEILNTLNELYIEKRQIKKRGGFFIDPPEIEFSEDALKEDRELLSEIKWLYENGLLPVQIVHKKFGLNHERTARIKKDEMEKWKDFNFWKPLFESKQGGLNEEESVYSFNERNPENATQPRPSN